MYIYSVKIERPNDRGSINIKVLFWVVIFALAIYAGYKVVPPYVSYFMLRTEVRDEAKIAHMYTDGEVASRIIEKARTWSVPIERHEIKITRWRDNIEIRIDYTVPVIFFNRYSKKFNYHIDVNAQLKESSGILH